jgi:hypothetical protein
MIFKRWLLLVIVHYFKIFKSYIFLINHLHNKSHCGCPQRRMMSLLIVIYLTVRVRISRRGCCLAYLACLENAREYYFILLFEIRERASQPLIHVRIYTYILVEFTLTFSLTSPTRSSYILPWWYSISDWLLRLCALLSGPWILLLSVIIKIIEH